MAYNPTSSIGGHISYNIKHTKGVANMITRVDFSTKGVSTSGSRNQEASSGSCRLRASQSVDIDLMNMRIQQAKMAQMVNHYYNLCQQQAIRYGIQNSLASQSYSGQTSLYRSGLAGTLGGSMNNQLAGAVQSMGPKLPLVVEDPKPLVPPKKTLLQKLAGFIW